MRLDLYLSTENEMTRSKAKDLIKRGRVSVDDNIIEKPSFDVTDKNIIKIIDEENIYVSRAGNKLEAAILNFDVALHEKSCLDIGSSTGGFTECLIRFGAKEVYSVDVGKDQFHESLKGIDKIHLFEETDIRDFSKKGLVFDIIVCDVSFISVEAIIDDIAKMSKENTEVIVLIKPQFEVGKKGVSKRGIVLDPSKHLKAIENVKKAFDMHGFKFCGIIESPIKGKAGNKEFLARFQM